MKKSRFTDSQILAILKATENDQPVTVPCREYVVCKEALEGKW